MRKTPRIHAPTWMESAFYGLFTGVGFVIVNALQSPITTMILAWGLFLGILIFVAFGLHGVSQRRRISERQERDEPT